MLFVFVAVCLFVCVFINCCLSVFEVSERVCVCFLFVMLFVSAVLCVVVCGCVCMFVLACA